MTPSYLKTERGGGLRRLRRGLGRGLRVGLAVGLVLAVSDASGRAAGRPARGAAGQEPGQVTGAAAGQSGGQETSRETPPASGGAVEKRVSEYRISAHVFLLGKMADVGTMTIEEGLARNDAGTALEKTLRMAGASHPEQVKKNRDYKGEFAIVELLPLREDGSVDEEAAREWQGYEKSTSSFLRLNKRYQAEKISFYRDHAVSTREDGAEKRVEGSYDCLLSPLTYFLEHEIKVGEVIETAYLLNGVPRIFRSEVKELSNMKAYKSKAYQIDISSLERREDEGKPTKDVWRKKGNIRVWFCKDGPYRNRLLKVRIKFRWYLWLNIEMNAGTAPADVDD